MHELTLAENVIAMVEAAAKKAGAAKVTEVRLALGLLAQIDVEALLYCCELVAGAGTAAGARFEVERAPGQAWCADCEQSHPLAALGDPCPQCGSFRLNVTGGEEMQVINIAVN